MRRGKIPGSIYRNGKRWWWIVKLPGEKKRKARPLKPPGQLYATTSRSLAEAVAWGIYEAATKLPAKAGLTLAELVGAYLRHADEYYRASAEPQNIRLALRPLVSREAADAFDAEKLKAYRQGLVDDGLARTTVNSRVNIVKRMVHWAKDEKLVPPETWWDVRDVVSLKRGRTAAREPEETKAVPAEHVSATLPFLSRTVSAMVELQLLTGARPSEICQLRPMDLDTSARVWLYRPIQHKTAHHGHERIIPLGPKAQKILGPFLHRAPKKFCFSPTEALQQLRRPGRAGERYNHRSYYRAVQYGIVAARKAGKAVPDWHPHQLRHTFGTEIRKKHGLEAARALLGHRSLGMADTYAEIDKTLAIEIARKRG